MNTTNATAFHVNLATLAIEHDLPTPAQRGAALAESGAVERLDADTFAVAGSNGTVYEVRLGAGPASCTCPDHQYRQRDCKHVIATRTVAALEPAPAPAAPAPATPTLLATPVGYICRTGRHGSTVTRLVPGCCSFCRVPMAPVYPTSRDAFRFPPRRCHACGEVHPPNADC